ncbi:MAG: hypothetical protein OXN83_06250, partial [Oligoflexia bacterium]|nr:hypothetical protein [Oligoflexia bacterium]
MSSLKNKKRKQRRDFIRYKLSDIGKCCQIFIIKTGLGYSVPNPKAEAMSQYLSNIQSALNK